MNDPEQGYHENGAACRHASSQKCPIVGFASFRKNALLGREIVFMLQTKELAPAHISEYYNETRTGEGQMRVAVILFALAICWNSSAAGAVTSLLGEQDFTNGQAFDFGAFAAAAVGETAPFDAFCGNDTLLAPACTTSWTFTFGPGSYSTALFTLGIFDHDSQAPGNQVSSFAVDGVDLTALLNGAFEGGGGQQATNNIYSFALPAAAIAALNDGSATFALSMQGPSLGGAPGTGFNQLPNNGVGLDFSRLDIDATAIPEPATAGMLALSLVLWGSQSWLQPPFRRLFQTRRHSR